MRAVVLVIVAALLSGCAFTDAGPWKATGASKAEMGTFRAGAAAVEFTPVKGYPLAGYGGGERRLGFPLWWGLGWPGRLSLRWKRWKHEDGVPYALLVPAAGQHDALQAKAVSLLPDDGPPFAIVRIDAIESTAALHARTAHLVADLGYKPETVVLAATHTHSGVGGFHKAPLAELLAMDLYRAETEERIARACADAIRAAHAAARPATLAFVRARDEDADRKPLIAKNRRAGRVGKDVDEIDRDVELVLLRDRSGAPIATLCCYAVHPTVLGTANRYFSSDLVGPAESAISSSVGGGHALFLNAAEGDVGPRAGAGGLRECRAEGDAFARVCSGVAAAARPTSKIRIRGALGEKDLGDPFLFLTPTSRARFWAGEEGANKFITLPLTLPANLIAWIAGFTNVRLAVTWTLSVGVFVDFASYGDSSVFRAGGLRIETEEGEDVFLFAAPCEPTHTVGLELKQRARARGASRVLVIGLADDAMSYVTTREEYFEGEYEALMTIFGPDTCEKLYDMERGVLDGLGYAPAR